ncbi:ABC transporter substrate-binding protein [Clostridium kluyveri]|uniref:ABC transporter substrate-binding protein n=1 Tax=Clostridium kluyveri TaxID=1534 RepID=A0A1L5F4A5_CLOKL|nr:ABC transporter substrate-binding protein [Clostridium kluyveri]
MGDINLKNLDILALLPCPLKVPVEIAFENHLHDSMCGENNVLNYIIEGNANKQISYNQQVEEYTDIESIPDITITSGINSFYYKNFRENFVEKGYFYDALSPWINSMFSDSGIKDPEGNYTIIALNTLVMVVDMKALGDVKCPCTWEELLKPEFEKRVAIRGYNDSFCETTLLTIFKQCGYEGIEKLGRAVKYGWHPSQMVKMAGSGRTGAPAVSVMPYFFTKTMQNKKDVRIIWPEDGAIVSPITMMVKKSCREKLTKIIDFFTGDKLGEICAGAFLPSLNPEASNKVPKGATFNWIGWDFIKERDIGSLIKELNTVFIKSHRGKL